MGGLLSFLLDFLPPHSAQSTDSDAEHQLCHGFLWTVWGENAMICSLQFREHGVKLAIFMHFAWCSAYINEGTTIT